MIDIITTAADLFGIEIGRLCGRGRGGRNHPLTQARQAVAWALREAGYTVVEIGEMMGDRDHSTICYASKQAERRAVENADYALLLAALRVTP